MARRRMIDPNFWQSEDVAKITIQQRLLLIGLVSNADDEGKLRGNPAFIRSIVFPYEDFTISEIESDLDEIEAIGTILQYEIEGNRYIKLINWSKFQRVDKPQQSLIPEPPQNDSKKRSKKQSENESENTTETDSRLKERKGKEKKASSNEKESFQESPSQEDENKKDAADAFNQITQAFYQVTGKSTLHPSQDDLKAAGQLAESGIPPDFILQTMKEIAAGQEISSMKYFLKAIPDRWNKEQSPKSESPAQKRLTAEQERLELQKQRSLYHEKHGTLEGFENVVAQPG